MRQFARFARFACTGLDFDWGVGTSSRLPPASLSRPVSWLGPRTFTYSAGSSSSSSSSRISLSQFVIDIFLSVATRSEAHQELNAYRRKQDTALVIRGESLEVRILYNVFIYIYLS